MFCTRGTISFCGSEDTNYQAASSDKMNYEIWVVLQPYLTCAVGTMYHLWVIHMTQNNSDMSVLENWLYEQQKHMNFLHTTMLTNEEDKNVNNFLVVMGRPHRSESMPQVLEQENVLEAGHGANLIGIILLFTKIPYLFPQEVDESYKIGTTVVGTKKG